MRSSKMCRKWISAAVCAVLTAVSVPMNGLTAYAATVKVGKTLAVDDKYAGKLSDLGSDIKTITFYVTCTKACTFSYGAGVSTSVSPDYWEELPQGKATLTANTSTPIKFDVSKIKLGTDKFEFRNYYSEGTLTLDKIVSNDSGSSSSENPGGSSSGGKTSKNTKSGTWSFKDNKDGTATVSTTLAAKIDDIGALLTAGKGEDDYIDEDGKNTWEEGDPINSRKLKYTEFGIPEPDENTKITLQSFGFSVSCKQNMDTFMYGCGLNVEYKSPADTEYWLTVGDNPDTKKGYWYNEHGKDADGNPDYDPDALEIEIGNGTTLESCGKWADVVWDVPEEVQPYATVKPGDAISMQFWYGANKDDGYEELKEVTLESATATFTMEKTIPYASTETISVGKEITQGDETANTAKVNLSELEDVGNVRAVKFTLSCPSAIKKLVFGCGISDKAAGKTNYTQQEFAILNAEKKQEIMWILPDSIEPDMLYGQLNFGYYYGADSSDDLVDSITLDKVELYCEAAPVETTTTTVTTTTQTTKTNVKKTPGDVDCSGRVDVGDAVLLARFLGNDPTVSQDITPEGLVNAECDGKDQVTSDDLTAILKYLARLIPSLG